jgi:hypothetical protein
VTPSSALALSLLTLLAAHSACAQQADAAASPVATLVPLAPDAGYAVPALEIIGFDLLLNLYNRRFSGSNVYDVNAGTIRRNLRGPWVVDNDPFKVNQAAHPYQGSMYHGAGRATGLSYWEASALTFAGSAWWEITGETTTPSRNDQVASGIAGSFLGEPLFRMAHLVLNRSDLPAAWRPWLAGAISPPVALNRLAFGSRFDSAFHDHDPEYYGRLHAGPTHAIQNDFDSSPQFKRNMAQADFALDYGLPGKPGYTYKRQRSREPELARPAVRHRLWGRRQLPWHLGPVRQLRLSGAAGLPRVDDLAVGRHDRAVVGLENHRAAGHRSRWPGVFGRQHLALGCRDARIPLRHGLTRRADLACHRR